MDVEKLKKLNQLSKELRNKGFDYSSDEVLKEAGMEESDFKASPVDSFSSQIKPVPVQQSAPVQSSNVSALAEAQIRLVVQQEFMQLRAEINSLRDELGSVSRRISELSRPVVQQVERSVEKQSVAVQNAEQVKKQDSRSITGGFTPGDDNVAIDKFFHCGK